MERLVSGIACRRAKAIPTVAQDHQIELKVGEALATFERFNRRCFGVQPIGLVEKSCVTVLIGHPTTSRIEKNIQLSLVSVHTKSTYRVHRCSVLTEL